MVKKDYSKEAYNIYKNRRGVDMNRVQQKKWISVLGMGVFILTMLSICILHSDEDKRNVAKNAAVTDKMQQNTDNDLPVDFPKDLFFNSGAGGWRTYLRLNRDGSFSGEYSDYDAYAEKDFPKGTVAICEFEGKFTDIERIDQYYYTMSLEKLEILDIPEMWIENGYRFLKEDEPYGLENGENFTLYMPETPIEQLSEDFLIWWPSWYYSEEETVRPEKLSCYGMCNEAMQYGFFSYEGMDAFEPYISK